MVKAKEAKTWRMVTPDMMSEEEAEGNEFIRHRPDWRSHRFNKFIEKLDNRYKSKHEKMLAKPRTYGDVVVKSFPDGIPSWMCETITIESALPPNDASSDEDHDNNM